MNRWLKASGIARPLNVRQSVCAGGNAFVIISENVGDDFEFKLRRDVENGRTNYIQLTARRCR